MAVVTNIVKNLFGMDTFCRRLSIGGTPQRQFPAEVGRKLYRLGAPRGSKSRQSTQVPQMVMEGDERTKADFLGAICDDEAEVRIQSGSKQITIKAAKIASLDYELNEYLNRLRRLFLDLGIDCSTPHVDRSYQIKGEERIVKRIWITGHNNFARFADRICLFHANKAARVQTLLQAG